MVWMAGLRCLLDDSRRSGFEVVSDIRRYPAHQLEAPQHVDGIGERRRIWHRRSGTDDVEAVPHHIG